MSIITAPFVALFDFGRAILGTTWGLVTGHGLAGYLVTGGILAVAAGVGVLIERKVAR